MVITNILLIILIIAVFSITKAIHNLGSKFADLLAEYLHSQHVAALRSAGYVGEITTTRSDGLKFVNKQGQ